MRVELEFDAAKIGALGYTMEQITATLKRICEEKHLKFNCEHNSIAYFGTGRKEDYSNIWIIISSLCNSAWFMKTATACRFYPSEKDVFEDVLHQAHLLIRKKA